MQNADIFHPPLPEHEDTIRWGNLHGSAVGLALARVMAKNARPLLIIAPDNVVIAHLLDDLHFFREETSTPIIEFPDWETLAYDHFSPHQDIISDRLATLYRLPQMQQGAIVTSLFTLMHRLPPRHYLEGHSFLLKQGDQLNIDALRGRLTKAGYHSVSQVREHGEFAIRGSIIDIFPMGAKTPFRIDLFDNEVDTIRLFSPDTQRSTEKIDEIRLLPAKEFPLSDEAIEHFRHTWRSQFSGNPLKCPIYQEVSEGICSPGIEYYLPFFFDETAALFDYLPKNTLIVLLGDMHHKAAEYWQDIQARYEQGRHDITRPLLTPEQLFISLSQLNRAWQPYPKLIIESSDAALQKNTQQYVDFKTMPAPVLPIDHKATHPLAALQTFIKQDSGRLLFCAETLGRREVILQLFKSISFAPPYFNSWQAFLSSGSTHGLVVAPLETGFSLNDPQLSLITETELYGKRIMQRRLRKKSSQDADLLIRDLTELQIGDPIVHIDHGVGRYQGLQTLTVGDQAGEFLCLAYHGSDKLYVPVASLHLISRYTGADALHAPIDRLGSDHWQKTKRRAAEKVRDVAAELLDLYAKRAARPGHAYQIPNEQYTAFAAAFPFEETPDQLHAIEQVFADMTSDKPMDRVICGDVGFGKTEVAMRAAFLSAMNGKQTAVLVPTTLLAQQHFQNFQDRFADWPVCVEMLSRFRSSKEQKNVLERMKTGKVDIVIGTHKLLQTDIEFKTLGLVIIDEEHRFGVKQKEKLKTLRSTIDILTLTATPIPRTMNMTLAGIRDLSIIATPPARRLSVKTFVQEYQDAIVREALVREIMRGGQVYFLHNDVATINKKAEEIAKLVAEARPCVAHGQMHERELERIMAEFYHRKSNVLVCTTIIESGIDIPTANTIIINRADQFGIAQLHQLRGRVGRSHHQAYAYLFIPSRQHITSDALKRLDAIAALDELGIGFTLATHDLEIRGAGELLGEEQSGNMHEIGFTLYMDMLSRAVDALKTGQTPDHEKSLSQQRADIDVHLSALIPEAYLHDVQLRLQFYQRIANTKTVSELDEIQVEMIDRFGLLPPPLKNLFAVTELKQRANAMGIIKIEANEKGGKLELTEKPHINPEKLIRLIQGKSQRFRLDGPTRLRFVLDKHEPDERIKQVHALLDQLS